MPVWLLKLIPDSVFIRLQYYSNFNKFPDLKNPVTFTEKLQWYKLHYRNPEMKILVDKYTVRNYVKNKGLEHILNELYFVKDILKPEDLINLRKPYILRVTHGSGMNIICRDDENTDIAEVCNKVNNWMEEDHFIFGREWAYKGVKPRVVCEKYLEDTKQGQLFDYKFYCCNGEPELIILCSERFSEEGLVHASFDKDWKPINVQKHYPMSKKEYECPNVFEEMKDIARTLAGEYPIMRVDLYWVNGHIIFGELTLYSDSGLVPFKPEDYNRYHGELIKLKKWTAQR